jgi:Tol biopolymer transport system component
LDLESGQQTNVTNHPSLDIEPAWSPDSQWIVFASNREDPNFDLYIIRPDGTGLTRLLNDGDSKDSYPSWR